MRIIELDASAWPDALGIYEALVAALEAPHWHGRNINALIDSMIYGEINNIDPPYTIRFLNMDKARQPVREEIEAISTTFEEALQYRLENYGDQPVILFELVP